MRRLRSSLRGQGKWALLCSVVLALAVAPFAVAGDGDVMRVGDGNTAVNNETRIVAQNVGTYATRQSNNREGDGGSATYGCRSAFANEPCLNVFALRDGRAFEFRSRGNLGGLILVGVGGGNTDERKPFTTNATGVATGLNADRVDGRNAQDFDALYQLKTLIAAVAANGALDSNRSRGVTAVQNLAGDGLYRVDFTQNVSRCAYSATETTTNDAGAAAVQIIDDQTLQVRTRRGADPQDPQDKPFHLVVTC